MSTEDLIRELEAEGLVRGSPSAPPTTTKGKAPSERRSRLAPSGLLLMIVAAVLVAIVGSLPFGSYALYPFALFVTLVHESGHALAAISSGGSVQSLRISGDLSGLTTTAGGSEALIAPAGYLGATLVGAALLLTPLRWARWALGVLAAIPLLALLRFQPASTFTALWCIVFAAALGLAAWKLRPRWAAFLQMLLGVTAGLNAFRDLMTLVFVSGSNSHLQTDAQNMSRALFLPATFWAILWTVLSVVVLVAAVLTVARRDLPLGSKRKASARSS